MSIALWIFGVLAVSLGTVTVLAWPSINRGTDNFGAGIVWLLGVAVAVLAAIIWAILAAIHWWPR